MAESGFLQQKPNSPTGLGIAILLHAAAIAGVVMIKNPGFHNPLSDPPTAIDIRPDTPPPRDDPPPADPRPQPNAPISRVDVPPILVPAPTPRPSAPRSDPLPSGPVIGSNPNPASGTGTTRAPDPPIRQPDPPAAVRREAQFDPRFAGAMQPPYPVAEERAEREGSVRVQVTIAANGRVLAATRVTATSDAFWRVTERQALSRWRFRPATLDGRPVESSKTLTVHFRLDGR